MANITIKQIEPRLIQRLRQRAAQNGRSLEAEITAILVSVLMPPAPPEPEQLEPNLAMAIKQRFAEVSGVELSALPRDPIKTPPAF